jgi:uncharacterized protein
MYNMGDSTYKGQPKTMTDDIVDALLLRVSNHCIRHGIRKFLFIFHGGEPLLAGRDFFSRFVSQANSLLLPAITPIFNIQTNGVLLSDEWCTLFAQLDIHIGISLDGLPEENDKFRVYHSGKGAYDDIVRGLHFAHNNPHLKEKPGIISVINIHADPIATYEHFKSLKIEIIHLLLPDATYDQPPPTPSTQTQAHPTFYADWLIRIFDQWFYETEAKPQIRLFTFIIKLILGESVMADNLGTQDNEVLVIETNGGIEALDVLKICGDGFTKANANVLTHELDESMHTDLARLFYASHTKLCKQCLCCPVKNICGGGYLPHRYSKLNGFNNPSVYCNDLLKLITHIQNHVLEQMPSSLLTDAGVGKLSFEEAKTIIRQEMDAMPDPSYITELEHF